MPHVQSNKVNTLMDDTAWYINCWSNNGTYMYMYMYISMYMYMYGCRFNQYYSLPKYIECETNVELLFGSIFYWHFG